jgi:hypothetical protein
MSTPATDGRGPFGSPPAGDSRSLQPSRRLPAQADFQSPKGDFAEVAAVSPLASGLEAA